LDGRSIYHGQRHIHYDAFEIIFYEQPNPKQLQFLALNPIELDISTKDMSDSVDAKKVTKQSDIVIQKNKTTIIDYSYQLNQEIQSDSDDLGTVLVQVK
jgi:phosphatidylinositol glycan class Q protein